MNALTQNALAEISGGTNPVASWPPPEPQPVDTWQLELLLKQFAQQEEEAWRRMMQGAAD